MELHHKLRRDPSWDPRGCNICGQVGHQAANCTSGTVNWRAIYGDSAFLIRDPVYWSEELKARKAKQVDATELEQKAREFAKKQAEAQGLSYDEIKAKAEELHAQDPTVTIKKIVVEPEEEPLPPGWATAADPTSGRTYYYHKVTQKVTWERPTAAS